MPMTLSSFIDVRPPAAAGRGHDARVHDGVDALADDDLGDHRVADVGADEVGPTEVAARRDHVDADGALDLRGVRELGDEASPEVAGDAGDEYDLTHGLRPGPGVVSVPGYLPDGDAGRASSSAACDASSSPCACGAS